MIEVPARTPERWEQLKHQSLPQRQGHVPAVGQYQENFCTLMVLGNMEVPGITLNHRSNDGVLLYCEWLPGIMPEMLTTLCADSQFQDHAKDCY